MKWEVVPEFNFRIPLPTESTVVVKGKVSVVSYPFTQGVPLEMWHYPQFSYKQNSVQKVAAARDLSS